MRCFDVRYAAVLVMNFLKPAPWEWDPFHTWNDRQHQTSWTKSNYLLVYSLLLILFSFTSMELYLCTNSVLIIQFQLVGFSCHVALSLLTELEQLANVEPLPAAEAALDIYHGDEAEILPYPEVSDDIYSVGL